MGLKDLKSDLSKFRIPKKSNLVDNAVGNVNSVSDKTPLSKMSVPNIPRFNNTSDKQGKEISKLNNDEVFKGETSPSKFDNGSKFLGETTPDVLDNKPQFLGETNTNPLGNDSKFLGEVDKSPISKDPKFLGETEKSPLENSSQFLGETDVNGLETNSQFLGETDTKQLGNDSQFLGETEKSPLENSSQFLGETNVNGLENSSQFLGETNVNGLENNSQFLGETEKSPLENNSQFLGETEKSPLENNSQFLGETEKSPLENSSQFLGETDTKQLGNDSQFLGETNVNGLENNSQFLGETDTKQLGNDSQFLGETEPTTVNFISDMHAEGFTQNIKGTKYTGINKVGTIFDSTNSLYSNIDSNSFTVGSTYETNFRKLGGLNSGETGFGLGKSHAKRNSPSYLDELYNRYNLKDDAYNTQFTLFKHPLILRGIQRRGVNKKEPQFWGTKLQKGSVNLIRGGALASTERALVDVVRISGWLASPQGVLWSTMQVGLQRTNRYGKQWTPLGLLAAVGVQHLGLKPDRAGILPFAPKLYKYGQFANSVNILGTAGLGPLGVVVKKTLRYEDIISMYRKLESQPDNRYMAWKNDRRGGFDSLYGIGQTTTNRFTSTFGNEKNTGVDSSIGLDPLKSYETLPLDKLVKSNSNRYNDFRLSLSLGNQHRQLAQDAGYDFQKIRIGYEPLPILNLDTNTSKGILLGNPGKVDKDLVSISKTTSAKLSIDRELHDSLNASDVSAKEHNDLVKFWIKADGGESVQFRGTINGLNDTFSPGWDSFKYNGRADQSYKYSTFERSVTFNFQVYATSRVEMKPIWNKINYLATMTMPKYGGSPGYEGTLVNFTLGDLYKKKLAFVESLNYTMPDELPWDINHDDNLAVIPTGIDVNISFRILDNLRPEIGQKVYDANFITTYL